MDTTPARHHCQHCCLSDRHHPWTPANTITHPSTSIIGIAHPLHYGPICNITPKNAYCQSGERSVKQYTADSAWLCNQWCPAFLGNWSASNCKWRPSGKIWGVPNMSKLKRWSNMDSSLDRGWLHFDQQWMSCSLPSACTTSAKSWFLPKFGKVSHTHCTINYAYDIHSPIFIYYTQLCNSAYMFVCSSQVVSTIRISRFQMQTCLWSIVLLQRSALTIIIIINAIQAESSRNNTQLFGLWHGTHKHTHTHTHTHI